MNFANANRGKLLYYVAALILALANSACGGGSSQPGTQPGTLSRSISVVLSPLSSSVVPGGTTAVSARSQMTAQTPGRHGTALQ